MEEKITLEEFNNEKFLDIYNFFIERSDTLDKVDTFDWSKVDYNYYNSEEYILSKFDKQFINSDFLKPILEKLIEDRKNNPIDPITELNKISNLNINEQK
jgi:hypothetical protein